MRLYGSVSIAFVMGCSAAPDPAPTPPVVSVAPEPVASAAPPTPPSSSEPTPELSLGMTIADYQGENAPGKVGHDFSVAAGDDVLVCFRSLQARHPSRQGRLQIAATIDEAGATQAVSLGDDTLGDETFAACVRDAVEAMTLPVEDQGDAVFEVTVMDLSGARMGVSG